MESARWEKIADLYEEASARPPAEWSAYLAAASEGDDDLRQEVESLLRHNVARDGVLEQVARDAARLRASAERRLPATIGRYRIVGIIGEGGMGVVYEAEQDHPRRTVAVKLLKAGPARPELLRRFERESEALGRLQHPGIAQIFEAGTATTDFGWQPYFAMEFVRGVSLLEHVKTQAPSSRLRLELVAKICDAVQHAHQRGIVHRDLKPNNILIDASGQPKVLDFGVARITDSDADATRQTDLGDLVGTLAYMSPEQVLGDPFEIGRAKRYLLSRRDSLRATGRSPAVWSEPQRFGIGSSDSRRGRAFARCAEPILPRRRRDDRPQSSGKGQSQTVRFGSRIWG